MKKYIRLSAMIAGVLAASAIGMGTSVSAATPACITDVLNNCSSGNCTNVLSNCDNGNCGISLGNGCQVNAECVQNLLNCYGCSSDELKNIINTCGVLPDGSQCADCNADSGSLQQNIQVSQPSQQNTEASQPNQETSTPTVQQTENNSGYSLSDYENQVVSLINQIRAENGLSALTVNTQLSNVARIKAQDMHDNGYFSHNSPTYGSPFDMMKQYGISYRTAGENIAMGQSSPQAVVDAWMNSEGHRANILNAGYTQIGMGYVSDGNYWCQMFIG